MRHFRLPAFLRFLRGIVAMKKSLLCAVALAVAALIPGSAWAHHGDAGRYNEETVTLKGTVVQLVMVNPHALIMFDVDRRRQDDPLDGGARRAAAADQAVRLESARRSSRAWPITLIGRVVKSGDPYMNLTERAQITHDRLAARRSTGPRTSASRRRPAEVARARRAVENDWAASRGPFVFEAPGQPERRRRSMRLAIEQTTVVRGDGVHCADACLLGAAIVRRRRPPSKPPMSDEVFKNVQVMKGHPRRSVHGDDGLLLRVARHVVRGLPHGRRPQLGTALPPTTPRKQTARRMIPMMQKINADNFGGRQMVTCYSCHRGADAPRDRSRLRRAVRSAAAVRSQRRRRAGSALADAGRRLQQVPRRRSAARSARPR